MGWAILVLLLWAIFFPAYFHARTVLAPKSRRLAGAAIGVALLFTAVAAAVSWQIRERTDQVQERVRGIEKAAENARGATQVAPAVDCASWSRLAFRHANHAIKPAPQGLSGARQDAVAQGGTGSRTEITPFRFGYVQQYRTFCACDLVKAKCSFFRPCSYRV